MMGIDPRLNIVPYVMAGPLYLKTPVLPASAVRATQGVASMAKTGPRLWAAFYGDDASNPPEAPGSFGIIKRSDDDGVTWVTDAYVTWPGAPKLRVADCRLWGDPAGTLWNFATCSGNNKANDGVFGIFASICENPQDANPIWSPSFCVSPFGCVSAPFQHNGIWHLPIDYPVFSNSSYTPLIGQAAGKHIYEIDWQNRCLGRYVTTSPSLWSSNDSWDETIHCDLPDGSLFTAARTKDSYYKTVLPAGGQIWPTPVKWTTPGTMSVSRAALKPTAGGRIALVFNNSALNVRSNMTIKLSEDGLASFSRSLTFDTRTEISYPDITIDGDDIYVVYDYQRTGARKINMVKMSEAALAAGTQPVPTIRIVDSQT